MAKYYDFYVRSSDLKLFSEEWISDSSLFENDPNELLMSNGLCLISFLIDLPKTFSPIY